LCEAVTHGDVQAVHVQPPFVLRIKRKKLSQATAAHRRLAAIVPLGREVSVF
jgi:hypothetical protein